MKINSRQRNLRGIRQSFFSCGCTLGKGCETNAVCYVFSRVRAGWSRYACQRHAQGFADRFGLGVTVSADGDLTEKEPTS